MDPLLLSKCKHALKHEWTREALKGDNTAVLKQIVKTLNRFQDNGATHVDLQDLICSCVPDEILLSQNASILRDSLPVNVRVELYFKTQPGLNHFTRETGRIIAAASPEHRQRFWQTVSQYVEFNDFLWKYAPAEIRAPIIQKRESSSHTQKISNPPIKLVSSVPKTDWIKGLELQPTEKALKSILDAFSRLRPVSEQKRFVQLLPEKFLELPNARRLRQALSVSKKIDLYGRHISLEKCDDFWIDELGVLSSQLASADRAIFWQSVAKDISHGSRALQFAPENIQDQISKRGFEDFFALISRLESWNPVVRYKTIFSALETYQSLTDSDVNLAKEWIRFEDKSDQHELSRMLSARAAEKIVLLFYKSMRHEVDDVAATQLDKKLKDWQTHDLLLDGNQPIDVKNARKSHKGKVYVEHIVQKFKKDRNLNNVTIVGVQSPYLRLEHIQDPSTIPSYYKDTDIIFLGETTHERLKALRELFSGKHLNVKLCSEQGQTFIPPWAFEYPERFYNRSDLTFKHEDIQALLSETPLELDLVRKVSFNPIATYLTLDVPIPRSWFVHLSIPQVKLIDQLESRDVYKYSLPYLYLSVLSHFAHRLLEGNDSNDSSLVYIRDTIFGESREILRGYPLGIYDPLETVFNLYEAICKLWENRYLYNLANMDFFKLTGKGILQGREKHQEDFLTLLAYCGGTIKGGGKCGYRPLIVGKNPTCECCRKLRCPKCDFCSGKNCERVQSEVASANPTDTDRLQNQYQYGDYESFE